VTPSFGYLREQTIGADAPLMTPFGERLMVYADYTASGRCLLFVENYLQAVQRTYANTHTEDDTTGRNMTRLLHDAEAAIKASVNAGPDGRIIACGTGATGAITKLQQMLGVYCPPATRVRLSADAEAFLGPDVAAAFETYARRRRPIVYVGPFEHHSNEVSWREGLAEVVEVRLDDEGGIDLAHLEALLQMPHDRDRLRIGSFSAASNVTGRLAPVHEIAALLHRHDAIACFDFAASGPYEPIDMSPRRSGDDDSSLDAIFLSPHKFLGGPGSSGILVFKRRLYREDLPPTVAAGGTVDYVSERGQEFMADIEGREKPGTPGTLQVIKAALAIEIKDWLTPARIEAREQSLLGRAFDRWKRVAPLEILGHPDPARRIAIVSFNVRCPDGRVLHPKFVTALLNDLFGIQSRAGCSCAGPYGHRLLAIDADESDRYRQCILDGHGGIKPGWCRLGFHFTMDDAEADFVIDAVEFVARYGHRFLPLYDFHVSTGAWTHVRPVDEGERLSLEAALTASRVEVTAKPEVERRAYYGRCLDEAQALVRDLESPTAATALPGPLRDLQFFPMGRSACD
jgi:selenocysteine lyase/cysteine desulfurase